jgi:natural product biosynthesis luciferase-like monooxygenase protein
MQFSLLFFSDDGSNTKTNKYQLLLDSAKFADQHGFSAVWTPERHFHALGGLYPNPAVIAAAIATITQHIQLRAGSVVLPLQNPIRLAEEWAVIDNLSQGRVGLAFASGWHPNDFALAPEHYANRREVMWHGLQTVQRLWAGEAIDARNGTGEPIKIRTFPRPVQRQLPTWVTCQSESTFIKAGKLGANVLTSLLYESPEELAPKIALYQQARAQQGHNPDAGIVSLMVHTYLGANFNTVKETVRQPFCNYLKTHAELVESLMQHFHQVKLESFSEADLDSLMAFGFERFFEGRVLMGTPTTCRTFVDRLSCIGVNEIACLIDFGLEPNTVMTGLSYLKSLKDQYATAPHIQEPGTPPSPPPSRAVLSR